VAAIVVATCFGMSAIAANIEPAGHDHGSGNHSPATETTDNTDEEQAPAPPDEEPVDHGHRPHGH
jgi:hypothetical protein